MKIFIVYCHPSQDSFTKNMCDAFIKGITDSGNEYIMSDLYKMDFNPVMTEQEYLRDANYRNSPEVASDVLEEQEKINSADAIAFIYPVFWTEAPARLVGWFDRVWSYGFAYGDKTMKLLDKAIILCSAGNPIEKLEQFGLLDSMKRLCWGTGFIVVLNNLSLLFLTILQGKMSFVQKIGILIFTKLTRRGRHFLISAINPNL